MRKKIKIIIFLFFVSLLFLIYFLQGIYLPKDPHSKEEIIFEIKKGEGGKEIAKNLKNQGLIKNATLFRVYTFFKGISKKLKAGSYLISPSMTIPEIAEKFVLGETIKEKITIIEGWGKEEIADYLKEKGIVEKEKFLNALNLNWAKTYDFLRDKPADRDIEGYLFPDTYYIDKQNAIGSEQLEELIGMMLENFDKKLTRELRAEINRQGKTIFEIVTMASMLEKEVKTLEDKKLVSGILWKRLENKIPLQVDATITYITGKKTTKISFGDTQIASPYNTYKYLGLPPGPICNPSLESILAAIYPQESEYWYYLSTPDGKTIFSRTLEEHNIAKAKYLK